MKKITKEFIIKLICSLFIYILGVFITSLDYLMGGYVELAGFVGALLSIVEYVGRVIKNSRSTNSKILESQTDKNIVKETIKSYFGIRTNILWFIVFTVCILIIFILMGGITR